MSLSADGNTAIFGGINDNANHGAAWAWTRSGGVWTQQGAKLTDPRAFEMLKPALEHAAAGSRILAGDSKSRPSHFDPMALAAFKGGLQDFRDIFETLRD